MNIVLQAKPVFKDRNRFKEIVDPLLPANYSERGLLKVLDIAASCVQEKVNDRPVISQIVKDLEALSKTKSHGDKAEGSGAHSAPSLD